MTELHNAWCGTLVRLRAVEPGDAARFHRFDADSEGQRLGQDIELPRSTTRATNWATEQAELQPDSGSANNGFAIESLEPGVGVVGHLNVHGAVPRHGHFEYGISIGAEFRTKGYAADALKLLLRYYFDELRFHRVSGIVYAFNEPSQRFHQQFGFRLEGRLRDYHYTAGRYHDVLWYGMTAPEFWAKYPECRSGPHHPDVPTLED